MYKWLQKVNKVQSHMTTKKYRMFLMAVTGLMIVAMAFVWSNTRLVGLAYEYQILGKNHRSLLRENHLLRVERESLQTLDRIQLLAKKRIGLKEPENGQIVTIFLKK